MSYNGWTNRETWLVNVWYDPECKADVWAARSDMEDEYYAMPEGPIKDMIDFSSINWKELEDHFKDIDYEEDEDD